MRNLLNQPGPFLIRDLERIIDAVKAAFPLGRHRRELPDAVRELSRILTVERDAKQAYWAAPRFLSAYLYYFLPWNLLRLAWVLPGLDLALKPESHIFDLGSGPLTLPLGLWLTKPELREIPLHFTCTDLSPRPMDVGRDIFAKLAGPETPWSFSLRRDTLEGALLMAHGRQDGKKTPSPFEREKYDLITAGNVLNEIPQPRKGTLAGKLRALAKGAEKRLTPDGRVFLLEPGTRLGGKLIALFRAGALQSGLLPLAPCPHWNFCPALNLSAPFEEHNKSGNRTGRAEAFFSGWCHFSHQADDAPKELLALTREADLEKYSLHLACLLLRKAEKEETALLERLGTLQVYDDEENDDYGLDFDWDDEDAREKTQPEAPRPERSVLRIISDPINLPAKGLAARYACSERGLALLLNGAFLPSGAAVEAAWPEKDSRDLKTGALEVEFKGKTLPRKEAQEVTANREKRRPRKPEQTNEAETAKASKGEPAQARPRKRKENGLSPARPDSQTRNPALKTKKKQRRPEK